MYIIVTSPVTLQQERINDVEIVEVYANGQFWAKAGPWESHECNPETNKVYNDDGTEAVIESRAKTVDNLKTRLQATEDALLFLMEINMGGGML